MKKFRFSLASVFAAVVVVAVLVSARGGLAAEAPLQAMWVATFLLSYGRSPQGGWRRIVRVTAAVSVVWSVLVACVYRWCMDRVGGPTEGLGSHGALIALSGSLTACGLACLVEAVRGAWHVWRGIGTRRQVIVGMLLLLSVLLAATAWKVTHLPYWEPTLVTRDEAERWELGPLYHAGQRQDLIGAQIVRSGDGRFFAARGVRSGKMLAFDAATGGLVARFGRRGDEWFGPLSFFPDGSVLTAILKSRFAPPRLIQWDTADWQPRDPAPLEHVLEWTLPGKSTSLFLDRQFVLVVDLRRVSLTDVDVDIRTADLLDDQPALSDPVPVRIDLNEFAPRTVDGFALDRIVWTCSPRGRWIAASCGALVDLSGADATSTKLPGGVIAFLGDGDHLVLRETSERLALKRVRINQLAPPFWDHLRRKTFRRVVIMDCRNRQVVVRSRWLDFSRLRMTCDQSGLVADQVFSGLLWSL